MEGGEELVEVVFGDLCEVFFVVAAESHEFFDVVGVCHQGVTRQTFFHCEVCVEELDQLFVVG